MSQLQKLINDERAKTGLPALTVDAKLTAAAKAHATDMLCNNYLSHNGLNGSTPQSRVEAAGFKASLVLEDLYALHPSYGGNPQSAFNWWMSDPNSKADLLNANTTMFGVAYVTSDESLWRLLCGRFGKAVTLDSTTPVVEILTSGDFNSDRKLLDKSYGLM